jgi:hypothetical protein
MRFVEEAEALRSSPELDQLLLQPVDAEGSITHILALRIGHHLVRKPQPTSRMVLSICNVEGRLATASQIDKWDEPRRTRVVRDIV